MLFARFPVPEDSSIVLGGQRQLFYGGADQAIQLRQQVLYVENSQFRIFFLTLRSVSQHGAGLAFRSLVISCQ